MQLTSNVSDNNLPLEEEEGAAEQWQRMERLKVLKSSSTRPCTRGVPSSHVAYLLNIIKTKQNKFINKENMKASMSMEEAWRSNFGHGPQTKGTVHAPGGGGRWCVAPGKCRRHAPFQSGLSFLCWKVVMLVSW